MSNIKKIIGVVLALVMVLSMASVAFAAEGDYYEISFSVVDNKTELAPGDSTTIEVRLTANFYVSAISIPIFFDDSQVDVVATSKLAKDDEQADRIHIADEDSDPEALKKFYESVPRSPETDALRAFVYIGKRYDKLYKYDNELIMELEVTAKTDAKSDTVIFDCIEEAIKTTTHPSGALYVAKNSSGNDEVDSTGEVIDDATITDARAEIKVVAEEEVLNTLKVKEDFDYAEDVVIDKDIISLFLDWYEGDYDDAVDANATGMVYGVEIMDYYLDEALTTELGDEYLVLTYTDAADGYDSTGTKIEVLAADKQTVLETYYFVYFGDVNGDGDVDTGDVSLLTTILRKDLPFDSIAQCIAADYNADTDIDTMDLSALTTACKKDNFADQGELAATFYEESQSYI